MYISRCGKRVCIICGGLYRRLHKERLTCRLPRTVQWAHRLAAFESTKKKTYHATRKVGLVLARLDVHLATAQGLFVQRCLEMQGGNKQFSVMPYKLWRQCLQPTEALKAAAWALEALFLKTWKPSKNLRSIRIVVLLPCYKLLYVGLPKTH